MTTGSSWMSPPLIRWPRLGLLAIAMLLLALLALACAPATAPTAAPAPAAPAPADVAAPVPEATAAPSPVEVPTEGQYIEKAGLRLFIPKGYLFGGPTIPPDPREPRYGGTAVRAHAGDPPSIDPYHTTSYLAFYVASHITERLIHYSAAPGTDLFNNPIVSGLAESWEVSEDFLTYTFRLRKGVKFHNLPPVNGRELDAEDVKATLDLLRGDGSIQKGFFVPVDRVEVIDKYTVALHMKDVDPSMLATLSEPFRGAILPRELADPATHARRQSTIGTGPMMVGGPYEFKVGISLVRNPDFWEKDQRGNRLPYLDGMRYVVIPDASARLTAFRTGKIDFGAEVVGGPEGMRALLRTHPTTLVQERASVGVNCICFRLDKAPWSDVRVRRAMSMAIDYEAISQAVRGMPAMGVDALVGGWWYGSDQSLTTLVKECGCPWYTYDPGKAKALLAEAGFPNGLSSDLAFFVYSQSHLEIVEFTAAYWKAIGVDVKLLSQDYTYYRSNVERGLWDNLSYSFTCCPNPASTVYGIMEIMIPGRGRNAMLGHINDPKAKALAEAAIASYKDEAAQRQLVREARVYALDQVFNIPTVSGMTYTIFSPRLRNFQPTTQALVGGFVRVHLYNWIDDDWSFAK